MKKVLISMILVCLLVTGSMTGASAAYTERVIDNADGSNCNSLCTFLKSNNTAQSCGSVLEFLSQIKCCDSQCKSLFDLLTYYGCTAAKCQPNNREDISNSDSPELPVPTEQTAPATQAPVQNPTEKPVPTQKPTETTAPAPKPTEATVPAPTPTQAPVVKPTEAKQESDGLLPYEQEVVRLVNEIRTQYGLNTLKENTDLGSIARLKSQDMHDKGYFSHTSPTYGTPFEMMKSFGVRYRTAGENIAMGYRSPQSVVDGWMNSPGHRANILNASFSEIGVGYVASGNYWTQMFIG